MYLGSPTGHESDAIADQLDEFDVDIYVVELERDIEIPDRARLMIESVDTGYAVDDVSDVRAPA